MKKLIIIPFLFVSLILSATNYYVKNGGNDSNTGLSDAQAWATFAKINASSFSAGDTIFFSRGSEWAEYFNLSVNHCGTDENSVVFTNYGTGELPVLNSYKKYTGWRSYGGNIWYVTGAIRIWDLLLFNGSWADVDWTYATRADNVGELDANHEFFDDVIWPYGGSDDTLFVYLTNPADTADVVGSIFFNTTIRGQGVHDIVIDGLAIKYNTGAISITLNSYNIEIKNCNVDWIGGNGMYFQQTDNLSVNNNTVSNCGGDGIYVLYSDTVDVSYNTVTNAGKLDYIGSDCQSAGFWYVANLDFHHNTIFHNGLGSVFEASAAWGDQVCENVNIFNNNITVAGGEGVFSIFAGNFNVYNNIVNQTIIGNTIEFVGAADYGTGSSFTYTSANIYNNTLYNLGQVLVCASGDVKSGLANIVLKNNIYYNTSSYYYEISSYWIDKIISDYNLYSNNSSNKFYNSGTTYNLSGWQTLTGQDVNSIIGDPSFVGGDPYSYRLAEGSPAIGAGTYVGMSALPDIGVDWAYLDASVPVTSITVSGLGNATTIATDNGTLQMVAVIVPDTASVQTVTWSRTNGTGSATISSGGLLQAVTDGTVTVRATAQDGSGVFDEQVITMSNQLTPTPPPSSRKFGKVGNKFTISSRGLILKY